MASVTRADLIQLFRLVTVPGSDQFMALRLLSAVARSLLSESSSFCSFALFLGIRGLHSCAPALASMIELGAAMDRVMRLVAKWR